MKGRALAAALALTLVLAPAQAVARTPDAHTAARVLVQLAPGVSDARRDAIARSVGAELDGAIPQLRIVRFRLAPGDDAGLAVATLARQAGVVLAEPDAPVRLSDVPNDPYWSTDPYTPGLGQWGMRAAKVDGARDLVKASPSIVVAVVDTGIDATHPDLAGVTVPGVAYVSAPSDGCGVTTRDENSHGTHVSGIIAANANNGIGIAGAASGVKIMPVRALDCSGTGSTSDIAMGVTWAVDHGARIVSISLGTSSNSAALENAVQYAIARGVLVVAASGNCGLGPARCLNTANLVEYPAAYPGVLAVGATSPDDTIAPFSTQGTQVGIAAPGVKIVSTTPGYPTYQSARGTTQAYAALSGTSQATPLVAAVAALVWSADPSLTAARVIERLESTADDLGVPGRDPAYGFGRVNALRAVTASLPSFSARYDLAAVPRAAATGGPFVAPVTVTNTSSTPWLASGTGAVRLAYHWVDAAGGVAVWDGVRTPLPADVPAGGSATVNANVIAPDAPGAYTLRLDLVRDGLAWFSQRGVATGDVRVTVGSGLGATYETTARTTTLLAGTTSTLTVTLTNTGTRIWAAGGSNPVRLAYHWVRPDGAVAVWDGARAPAFAADVPPGGSVTAQLTVEPPPGLGPRTLRLDLVEEGVAWFSARDVAPRDLAFTVSSGFDAAYTVPPATLTLLPGARASLTVGVKNTGPLPWNAAGANPVRLAAHVLDAAGNVVVWDGPRTVLPADVPPGASGAYQVVLDAPLPPGTYRARVELVREGVSWFSALGVVPAETTFVVPADLRAQITVPDGGTPTVSRAAPSVRVSLTNPMTAPWSAAGPYPVHLASHWYDAQGNLLLWDGPRVMLPSDLAGGESVSLDVALAAPPPGAAALVVDLVIEGVRWFGAGRLTRVVFAP